MKISFSKQSMGTFIREDYMERDEYIALDSLRRV
jgi:hypothetical protein